MADSILEWLFEHFLGWVVLIVLAGCVVALVALPYMAWRDSHSPTVELNKSDWACTHAQVYPVTTYVMSGKVMIPITTYSKQCDQWTRR